MDGVAGLHFRDWFRWCRFRCLGLVYRASGLVGVGVCLFGRERLGGLLGGLGGFHEPRWTEPRLGSFRIGLGLLRGAGLLIGCALWRGTEEFPRAEGRSDALAPPASAN